MNQHGEPKRNTAICPSCGGRMVPGGGLAHIVLKPHQRVAYCEDCGYECVVKTKDLDACLRDDMQPR